jgi:hypothetical protein
MSDLMWHSRTTSFCEKQWKNDVAGAARNPHGQKKECSDKHEHCRIRVRPNSHGHVKQRRPSTQKHMAGMRKLGSGPKVGYGNSDYG